MSRYDIIVIGGGVLGTCISYWLSSLFTTSICVIEKESDVAMHASSRNTGIAHSPFYLNPRTRSRLARATLASRDMWALVAKKHKIPWSNTGVLELALNEVQYHSLKRYMRWGKQNGIPEDSLALLDSQQVSRLEPNVRCHSAIHCSLEVSTDFGRLTRAIRDESARHGTKFLMHKDVVSIKKDDTYKIALGDGSTISANILINCAGGNSLDVAQMLGLAESYSDLHFRGEYWVVDPKYQNLAKSTLYTVAEFEEYPFLDPHWIKKPDGTAEVGPNAVPVPSPETYSGYMGDATTAASKLAQVLTGGALKLFSTPEFIALISKEWLSSVSKTVMISRIRKFLPDARPGLFPSRGTAGIRSPVITPEGRFLPDVMEIIDDHSLHILNYNSPGATGAPAYSAYIIQRMQETGMLDLPESHKDMIWRTQGQS